MLDYDAYVKSKIPKSISGTSFLSPIQKVILNSRYKPEIDPDKKIASSIGTAVHEWYEKECIIPIGFKFDFAGDYYEVIGKEVRFAQKIKGTGMTATGTADLVFLINGTHIKIGDYKTTKDWIFKARKFDKWVKQLSIYNVLAHLKYKHPVSEYGVILYYNKTSEAAGKPSLGHKELKLMSLKDTRDFMVERAKEIESYWDLPEDDLHKLPNCTQQEMRLCSWCGHIENCPQLNAFANENYTFKM